MSEEAEEKGIDDLINDLVWPEKSGRENSKELIFEDIVPELWSAFKLKGKSDLASFEAFLIKVIIDIYEVKIGNLGYTNRSNAKKRDSCLLAFGLLRGYYHTDIKDGNRKHIKLDDRRIEYLNSSDFTMIDYGRPYKEIEAEEKIAKPGKQPTPLNTLNSSNNKRVDELIKHLQHLVKRDRVQSLMDGADAFVQPFILPNGELEKQVVDLIITEELLDKQKVRRVVLPEPIYTLANFSRQSDQDIEPAKDNPQEAPQQRNANEGQSSDDLLSQKEKENIRESLSEQNNRQEQIEPSQAADAGSEVEIVPEPTPESASVPRKNEWASRLVKFLKNPKHIIIVLLTFFVPCLVILIVMNFSENIISPGSIRFVNEEIFLPLGSSHTLSIETKPDDADLSQLECESSNPDVVKVISKRNLHIRAADSIKDDDERKVYIKAYMSFDDSIRDEMTVQIIESGVNDPKLNGINDE